MTTLAQRPRAEVAPVGVDFTGPIRTSVGTLLAHQFETFSAAEQEAVVEEFPAWSSLTWDERAEYVARYCF